MMHNHNSKSHGIMKIVCFVAVFAGLFFIFKSFINFDKLSESGSSLWFLMLLLCPLMHLFMMRGHGGHGSCHNNKKQAEGQEDNNSGRNTD